MSFYLGGYIDDKDNIHINSFYLPKKQSSFKDKTSISISSLSNFYLRTQLRYFFKGLPIIFIGHNHNKTFSPYEDEDKISNNFSAVDLMTTHDLKFLIECNQNKLLDNLQAPVIGTLMVNKIGDLHLTIDDKEKNIIENIDKIFFVDEDKKVQSIDKYRINNEYTLHVNTDFEKNYNIEKDPYQDEIIDAITNDKIREL